MRNQIILFFAIFIAITAVSTHQVYAQSKNNVVEIISIDLPDSVVFKITNAARVKQGTVTVYIVSGVRKFEAREVNAKPVGISRDRKGGLVASYTDETIFYAKDFYTGFEAKKLKFIVDKKTFVYNIEKSKWE